MTYGAGVAIKFFDTLPIHLQKAENDKNNQLGIDCKCYGCFVKGYKTKNDDEEIKDAVHVYLQKKIQRITVSVINTYFVSPIPDCLHGLQNFIHRGVTDSTFAFYESLFGEKVMFRLRCFVLQYLIASDYSL